MKQADGYYVANRQFYCVDCFERIVWEEDDPEVKLGTMKRYAFGKE